MATPFSGAAISSFWKRPAEHLNVAEEICYDGTPSHSQRTWAEKNGWIPREFTVTWDSAVELLDRGVPFTLTITFTALAHLQAIAGYDANVAFYRQTVLTGFKEVEDNLAALRILEEEARVQEEARA